MKDPHTASSHNVKARLKSHGNSGLNLAAFLLLKCQGVGRSLQEQFNEERDNFGSTSQGDAVHHDKESLATARGSMTIRAGCKEIRLYPNMETSERERTHEVWCEARKPQSLFQ